MRSHRQYQPIRDEQHLPQSMKVHEQHDIEMVTHNTSTGIASFGDAVSSELKSNKKYMLLVGVVSFIIIISLFFASSNPAAMTVPMEATSANFDSNGRYILENYDSLKPMANFLCGIGGLWGVPMWAFYVNRGQGITSFGINNKDGAIAKFNTAEKAYQQTPFTGFRTFVKGTKSDGTTFASMPFFPKRGSISMSKNDDLISRNMMIGTNEMEIQEIDSVNDLQTNVLYYTIPNEDFPSLVRKTTFTNLDEHSSIDIEVLDGLGRLVPSGLGNWALDAMGRTMEAWMNVYNVNGLEKNEPFFHISQGTADSAQVQIIKDGHFSVAFVDDDSAGNLDSNGLYKQLPFIVDPSVVFDTDTTLTDPRGFFASSDSIHDILALPQGTTSRTPCAFAGAKLHIEPGKSVSIITVYGHSDNVDQFVGVHSPLLRRSGYVNHKREEAEALANGITDKVATKTSSSVFDAYVKQDFLDNVLRGGLPIALGDSSNPKIYHTFSRIHGDIERDYNNFQIDTTYFSQGPGNFRDVNQNRRMDVLHTPVVGDFNIRMFLSFVQADAYNPLTVATTNFKIPASKIELLVPSLHVKEDYPGRSNSALVASLLRRPFRIGQLFNDFKTYSLTFDIEKSKVVDIIVSHANQEVAAQYAQNGFWADHWTYTLDLVENYLTVFPDKESSLLFESAPVPFYMSPAVVRPRHTRYSLVASPADPSKSTIRVYNAVSAWGDKDFPTTRVNALNTIYSDPSYVADTAGAGGVWQRTKSGDVFAVPIITKLAMLGILKFSTLDPNGMGVEMEGGKPGWNDAMNGLPGILGSGMPETYEMLRVLRFVKAAVLKHNGNIQFPTEFYTFIEALEAASTTYASSSKTAKDNVAYWDACNTARETYRDSTVATFDGSFSSFSANEFVQIISKMEMKTEDGIARALATNNGLSPTYFHYECTDYSIIDPVITDPTGPAPPTQIIAKSFDLRTLPLFLEGPTRHMKVVSSIEERRNIYNLAKESKLYDSALQMFTISESLIGMGQDVGRMMAFSPGWLENQSVWLHMSYKFYLELLRGGLYDEFYTEIKTGLVPFMDNEVYGRSPLEAASFIVSSAFPDKKLHGASFLARLSGSTAEFLSMWAIMFGGDQPFTVNSDNELVCQLQPKLHASFFTVENTVSFTFLGEINVTYYNPERKNTWDATPQKASVVMKDGTVVAVNDAIFVGDLAHKIRNLEMWSRLWSLDSWFSEPRVKTVKKLNPADYDQEKVEELNNLLFPNVSSIIQQTLVTKKDGNGSLESTLLNVNRNLASTPVCVLCSNLQYCKALNGLLIQEVYLPGNPDQLGTCRVYEDLGERIYNEIFGIGKTFRDSDQCKLIVMQYLCLMWGSDNLMYKSECHSCCEDVSDPNPNNRRVAPLYPCRSFCTQISQVCAYDKNYIQLCERIPCGESNDYCTPDPSLDNAVLATGLGCDFPVHANPYATGHAFRNTNPSAFNFICLFILIYIFTIMKQ